MSERPYDYCYTCGHHRDAHGNPFRFGGACDHFRLAVTVPADEMRDGQSLPPGTYTFTGMLK